MYMYQNPIQQTEINEMKPNEHDTEMKTAEMSKTHHQHWELIITVKRRSLRITVYFG